MTRYTLPVYKTGWFYLLLGLWGAIYWFTGQGGFNWLNQLNRERLFQASSVDLVEQKVVRLESLLIDSRFERISKVLARYPSTPVLLIGSPSAKFNEKLQKFLKKNPRKAKVTVATKQTSSASDIAELTNEKDAISNSLNWFRYPQPEQVRWRTSSNIVFSPLLSHSRGGIPLVWQNKEKMFLTIMGEVLRQTSPGKDAQVKVGWNIELVSAEMQWPLGMNGEVYSAGPLPLSKSTKAFLVERKKDSLQLIIIDDNSHPMANEVVRTTERLLQHNYLYQNITVIALQWILLIAGVVMVWYASRLKILTQLLIILGFIGSLWMSQYLIFRQMQWLEILPTIVVVFFSWIIFLAYQRESFYLEKVKQHHNILLAEALPIFYQTQQLEKVQQHLAQTSADIKLIDTVFDIALQAEAVNNNVLAKKLLMWIQNSGIKHVDSEHKLLEIQQKINDETLGKTLVLEPGKGKGTVSINSFANVKRFGRYLVKGVLGKGAMGIVFRGVDPKINRHVAIKTLQLTSDQAAESIKESKKRFFREAETAGNLSHANIVTIYDVGEERNLGYIAMDLLTGAPLSDFLKPELRLSAALIYQLMIQITDALDYAHKQGVVHRDIKPGNIIFDKKIKKVTVTDFGIAYVNDHSKTRTGTIMGSPYYMSPEQILGRRVDGRSDIFSLGVTFYQLLSGNLPFNGESIASVAYHITKSKQLSVRQWDKKLPASAARITNKAMHKEIGKRYQTMQEFKQALINALKRDFKKAPIV